MSRPNDSPRPDDPDETPTRVGGSAGGSGASGGGADESPTVPSLKKGGNAPRSAPQPQPQPSRGPQDPLIGKELGGCRITGLLGRGAMGAVYRARQLRLDRDVAVKVIRPEMMTDARTLKRFEVEARTVGQFNSAHVVMVHDVGYEQGVHYLVMEFVQGKNLRDHVKLLAGGRLPAAEAIPLLRQACKGLEEAQRLLVIHRDIKPDNLMLTDRGILKIADFGIAKPIQEDFSMTLTSELIGTPLYMSPEQCQGAADLDFRSDMYSLGATFYYLLTGEPPVRASSVYELIQTKTKLENLCLWKALPELDENHPLSRVVERMTALDRDDRYESYEALLNDIVLVEAGGTVHRMAPRPEKKALPTLAAPAKKQRGIALAAVLALVAVGGVGAWWATRDPAGHGSTNPGDPALVTAKLTNLRGRLTKAGPSAQLREDLVDVPAEGREVGEKTALLAAVDQGLGVQQRLAKIRPPEAVEPPFDSIEAHFAAVDTATKVDGTLSPLLADWHARAKRDARAEETLGAKGVGRLAGTFTKWRDARAQAGADTTKLAALDEQLKGIEASRRRLMDLLPGVRADLDRDLSSESLDKARRSLAEDTLPADVDVGEVLAEIRAEFDRVGPDEALSKRAAEQRPSKPAQARARDELINDLARARDRKTNAEDTRTSYPRDPQMPFDDVASYFERLENAFVPLRGADKKLPPWADTLRTNLRDEQALQASVVGACSRGFRSWKQDSAAPGADKERLTARLAALTTGKRRAIELFPAAKEQLDSEMPEPDLAQAHAGMEQAASQKRWVVSARDLGTRIEALRTLADWRSAKPQLVTEIDASDAAAAPFGTDAEVQREKNRIGEIRARWTRADTKVEEVGAKIAAGELTAADASARATHFGDQGKEELRLLAEATTRCVGAFAALEQDLDLAKAQAALNDARAALAPIAALVPAVEQRIVAWIEGVKALERAAAGMIAIPGGTVRGVRVESFFLSATEVSRAEYGAFLNDLRAAVAGKDGAAKVAAVAPRLGAIGIDEDALQQILGDEPSSGSAKLPADRLCWYGAAAFAAWRNLSLPMRDEWLLAAFGDDKAPKQYPWGNDWSNEPQHRNADTSTAAAIDDGGVSWRSPRLHHLAGNMAEWLHAAPTDREAGLAGGRHTERSLTTAKEQARGEMSTAPKSEAIRGFGARTLLRPRSFTALAWPK